MISESGQTAACGDTLDCLHAALGSLVTAFVHNLNNFLVGIVGNIDLAGLYPDDSDKVQDRILDAREASIRIRDFLAVLIRFRSRGEEWSKESFLDMAAVARLACGRSMSLESSGQELLPGSLPVPDVAFRAVLLSLLGWAVESCSGKGSIRMGVEAPEGSLVLVIEWESPGCSPERPERALPRWMDTVVTGNGMSLVKGDCGPDHGQVSLLLSLEPS